MKCSIVKFVILTKIVKPDKYFNNFCYDLDIYKCTVKFAFQENNSDGYYIADYKGS